LRGAAAKPERQVALDAFSDQARTGIRKTGHPGVCDQRDILAGRQSFRELFRTHRFIMFMIANEWLSNLEMAQEISGMTRVFRRDHVRGLQTSRARNVMSSRLPIGVATT
jgi:hypothetical protein